MMIRTGSYILSSNMLVILSLDRFSTNIEPPPPTKLVINHNHSKDLLIVKLSIPFVYLVILRTFLQNLKKIFRKDGKDILIIRQSILGSNGLV